MQTTFFFKKNGSLSSIRNSTGNGKNSISFTSSSDGSNKGVTYKTSSTITRINKNGGQLDFGTHGSGRVSYFHNNSFSNKIRKY